MISSTICIHYNPANSININTILITFFKYVPRKIIVEYKIIDSVSYWLIEAQKCNFCSCIILGEPLEKQQQKSTVQHKYGMQTLGKVPNTRRGPVNLPSLKAEHSGSDTAVSLVPTSAPGWGKQDATSSTNTTTSSVSFYVVSDSFCILFHTLIYLHVSRLQCMDAFHVTLCVIYRVVIFLMPTIGIS